MTGRKAVVVGAGIIGLAVAERLDRDGWRLEIVDAAPDRPPASAAAAGMLSPLAEAPANDGFLAACREARDLWRDWAPELSQASGVDIDHDTSGALLPTLDAEDQDFAETLASRAHAVGEPCEWIDEPHLRRHLPTVAGEARRALWLPGEHRVDNRLVLGALERVMELRHVGLRRRWPARSVEVTSSGARLRGDLGAIEADLVIIAAGAWSSLLEAPAPIPVRPVRGQMISYADAAGPWTGTILARDGYAVLRRSDGLAVGATVEEAGFDGSTTADAEERLRRFIGRLFPSLRRRRPTRSWAGLRPASADARPLVGFVAEPSVLAVTGHFRNGILLAPWTAREVSRLLAGDLRESVFSLRCRS